MPATAATHLLIDDLVSQIVALTANAVGVSTVLGIKPFVVVVDVADKDPSIAIIDGTLAFFL